MRSYDYNGYRGPAEPGSTLRSVLKTLGVLRLEIVLALAEGESGVDFALDYPGLVTSHGSGIAVRTSQNAHLLSNTNYVTVPRPDDCVGGCVFSVWLTSGYAFARQHPEIELVVFAGQGAEARVSEIDELPADAFGSS